MPRQTRQVALLVTLTLLVAVFASACSTRGGGWLPSAEDPDARATFGFRSDSNDDLPGFGTIRGTYHDQAAGVRLKFLGDYTSNSAAVDIFGEVLGGNCPSTSEPLAGHEVPYESQDSKNPGTGTLYFAVCDGGDGQEETGDDFLFIRILSGPFVGYVNSGYIQGGNIQFLDN